MAKWESWPVAYSRILGEVRAEHPDWTEREVYIEYRTRCEAWKLERGIR